MEDNSFEVEPSTPLLPEQHTGDAAPIDQEPEGPRSPLPRKRVIHIALALVAIVVVAVTFRGVITPTSPPPGAASSAATDLRPSLPPLTLVNSNINFGVVTVNGEQARGPVPLFFSPPRDDLYTLVITAPPFEAKACAVKFIGGAPLSIFGGDCFINSGDFPTLTANGLTATPAYVVTIEFRGDDLPQDQQDQINTLLTGSITAQQTTTVPAGSYIATRLNDDGTIISRRTSVPLKASASLRASDQVGSFGIGCGALICSTGGGLLGDYPLTGQVWAISVSVALRWRFTTSGGDVLGDVSFPATQVVSTLLTYTTDTGWGLSSQSLPSGQFSPEDGLGNLDCATGALDTQQQLQGASFSVSWPVVKGIEGCLISIQPVGSVSRGTLLWRFGVLLAVNDEAHALLPRLPIAPPAEVAAAQDQAGRPTFSS